MADPNTDPLQELGARWARARCAALRTIVPEASADVSEVELVRLASARDPAAALTRVFDNSRTLGLGFRRFYRVDLTLPDVAELLPALGAPCHACRFARDENEAAWQTEREPCTAAPASAWCDHWRESVLGLVGGVSTGVRYSRVDSGAHGGRRCADLLHVDPTSPLRFAPIDEEIQAGLTATRALIQRMSPSARLEFLGMSEGVLHYTLHAPQGGCGGVAPSATDADALPGGVADTPRSRGGLDLGVVLAAHLRRRFPALRTQDASPRPVLSETT